MTEQEFIRRMLALGIPLVEVEDFLDRVDFSVGVNAKAGIKMDRGAILAEAVKYLEEGKEASRGGSVAEDGRGDSGGARCGVYNRPGGLAD